MLIMRFIVLLLMIVAGPSMLMAQQGCRSTDYKQALLNADPGLFSRMQSIERFTQERLKRPTVAVNGAQGGGQAPQIITIPVVVHVVYNSSAQNISDDQINSQILVLNRDYRKLNTDTAQIPSYYRELAADCRIQFALAAIDTNGNSTTGIVRTHTNVSVFSYNDAVKFKSKGGDDGWDRDRYLNLWVCKLTDGILGYASIPGSQKPVDGVVIDFAAFGTKGAAQAPYNLGRTATHEIGHWLNLIHIWGDSDCGDDYVDDTPTQQTSTRGNPSGMIFSCGNTPYGNLYMDYMDFTDDIGMHLFTYGQRARMLTLFADGGFRQALLSAQTAGAVNLGGTDPVSTSGEGTVALSVSMYPNPAAQIVEVKLNDASGVGSLMDIYNQRGQIVLTTRIASQAFPLNISTLGTGLYFASIRNGGKNLPFKLVKIQ